LTKTSKLWEKLPNFIHGNKTVRAKINSDSDTPPSLLYSGAPDWKEVDISKANMILSRIDDEDFFFNSPAHRPILDIDYEAELVPSSTPGHYHLYLDKTVGHAEYMKFLKAAAEAGIVQWGYYEASEKRGASSVRLPWIKKGDPIGNSGDPDAELKQLKDQIAAAKKVVTDLQDKLDLLEPF
jgi:hypothetical protein